MIAIADGRTAKEKQFSDASGEEQTAAEGERTAGRRHRWTLWSLAAQMLSSIRLQLRGATSQLHLFPLLSQLITSLQRPASPLRRPPPL